MTIAQRAKIHGLSPNLVYQRISRGHTVAEALAMGSPKRGHGGRPTTNAEHVVYPALAEYITTNGLTMGDFAMECDISYSTAYQVLFGQKEPLLSTIQKICNATMIPFEEAFKR